MLKETNKTGQVEEDSLTYYNIFRQRSFTHERKNAATLNGCIESERERKLWSSIQQVEH